MGRGRNQIGGQWAPYPFNLLLSNPTTPDGLPPDGSGRPPGDFPAPPTQEELDRAAAALLGLGSSAKVTVTPAPISVAPRDNNEAIAIAVMEALQRIEAKLDKE